MKKTINNILIGNYNLNNLRDNNKYFYADNFKDLLNLLKNEEYQIFICNFFLKDGNIFDLLEIINNNELYKKPLKIILIIEAISSYLMDKASFYKIDYLMVEPIEVNKINILIDHFLKEIETNSINQKKINLNNYIVDVLHEFGIASNLKGYNYLKEALNMAINDQKILESITKNLYPEIARMYNTTSTGVERAMRTAIENSFLNGNIKLINDVFRYSVSPNKSRPTNSIFIHTLSERIKAEFEKQHN